MYPDTCPLISQNLKVNMSKNIFDGFESFFEGVGNLVGKLNELSEKESFSNVGEFDSENGRMKGGFGFNIRFGTDGTVHQARPEPSAESKSQKSTPVGEIKEPLVDIIQEGAYLSIFIEMPGLTREDVTIELKYDLLIISGAKGKKKYAAEVILPEKPLNEELDISCNNGIFEVRCQLIDQDTH